MESKTLIVVVSVDDLKQIITNAVAEVIKAHLNERQPATDDSSLDQLLTYNETCALLKTNRSTLFRWIKAGLITPRSLGSTTKPYFRKSDIIEALKAKQKPELPKPLQQNYFEKILQNNFEKGCEEILWHLGSPTTAEVRIQRAKDLYYELFLSKEVGKQDVKLKIKLAEKLIAEINKRHPLLEDIYDNITKIEQDLKHEMTYDIIVWQKLYSYLERI